MPSACLVYAKRGKAGRSYLMSAMREVAASMVTSVSPV